MNELPPEAQDEYWDAYWLNVADEQNRLSTPACVRPAKPAANSGQAVGNPESTTTGWQPALRSPDDVITRRQAFDPPELHV
jgi:hypothetical protein